MKRGTYNGYLRYTENNQSGTTTWHHSQRKDFQESDRFPDTCHVAELSHEAKEHLNKPITESEMKSAIRSLSALVLKALPPFSL